MSLNTAHLNGGVLIHNGEQILLYSDGVGIEWNGQQTTPFQGVKKGSIYLTTHRVIFLNKSSNDEMLSFSFPFITLSEVDIEQPVFGANYIKGKVRAQPNGNWIGEAKFKITFKHGGAIEFGQAMLRVAHLAINSDISGDASRGGMQAPPPYVPPQTQWYAAPPPAYAPPPQGYYGWTPPTNVFPQQPPSDGVFMTDAPPPYPGIVPGYQANGYGPPQGAGGFGGYPQGGPPSYPGTASGSSGYNQGAGGFQQPQFTNAADAKAHEAAQSAYYDPNRPQMAYVPPPAYYENPPTYNQATNKKNE
ncbi:WW domain-binding protein 2 isoform X1 [Diorhabda carinulata]|uniref:WW domain-binding protein 2 isoform X1 n=1 Tax=Diorhabda carinulata TaxID=1163345 RepID=UPI0025A1C34A|nr:WW domain-binding protein 2 isoform X1 [Diorhabda carinulata]